MDHLAEQAVDAINDVAGTHPGARAAHAKGTVLAGTFTPAGSGLTRAAHMQQEPVRVTARFSNGGGDPGVPDYAREGRGLAVKFYLPDGSRTDVVALSLPCFIVRTPEDFVAFTRARKPDAATGQPDLEKVGAFVADHPEAILEPTSSSTTSRVPCGASGVATSGGGVRSLPQPARARRATAMSGGRGTRPRLPGVSPRVGVEVDVLEPLGGQMRVELGRGDVGVAEHLLQGAQVAAARQQVRRERVAQRVRAHLCSSPALRAWRCTIL